MAKELSLNSPNNSFLSIRLALLHHVSYLFFVIAPASYQDCNILDVISDNIETNLCFVSTPNIFDSLLLMRPPSSSLNILLLILSEFIH